MNFNVLLLHDVVKYYLCETRAHRAQLIFQILFTYFLYAHLLGHAMQASPFIWCALSVFYYSMCIRVQLKCNKAYCCNFVCTEAMYVSPCAQALSTIHIQQSIRSPVDGIQILNTHETYPPTNQPANHPPTKLTNKTKISSCLTCESNLYTAAARSLWHTFYRNFCHFISAINFSAPYTLGSVRFWIASK